jgi:lipid A ethanolaminephosphotransferase
MSLRLFHVTEFAQSQLLSPASQRNASHPYVVVLLFSLWLASIGNLALWQALYRVPDSGAGKVWWSGIVLALMMYCAVVMLLCVLNWRWTLKLLLTLLLLLAAFNAYYMLSQNAGIDAGLIKQIVKSPGAQFRALLNWQWFFIITLMGVLPIVVLRRMSVRRTTLLRNLFQNLALFGFSAVVLASLWLFSHQMVLTLFKNQPQLRQLLNPFNVLQALAQMLGSVFR